MITQTEDTQVSNINWQALTQVECRSKLRDMLNSGELTTSYDVATMRKLINGETITNPDGRNFSLSTGDLRNLGETKTLLRDLPQPPERNDAADNSYDAEDREIDDAIKQLEEIKARRSRPVVDDAHITDIAGDVVRDEFEDLFNKAVKDSPVAFTDAVGAAVAKFQSNEMQAAVSAFVQSEFGQSLVSQVKAGDKTLLPPLRPVSSSFCENRTTRKIEQMIWSRFHIIVSGDSGSGKTYPVEQVLNKHGRRWLKISCADGISMSELLAEKTIEVEQGAPVMKVVLKAIPVCVREGIVLIMDEGDQLAGEILSLLNPVTDSFPATLTVPQTGERIVAHKDFQMIMTCNGLTDETGLYSGHQISGALKTRVRFIHAPYLTKTEEVKILVADGLSQTQASDLVDVFKKLRQALEKGVLTMPPSTRTMLSISKAMQGKDAYGDRVQSLSLFDMQEALEFTVLDALPKTERKAVKQILNA